MIAPQAVSHVENLQQSRRQMLRIAIFGGVGFALLAIVSTFFIQLSGAVIANGHIIPRGENIVLQHADGGLIKDVFVEDGDTISEGQELIKFDGSELQAELERLQSVELELSVRLASTKAALEGDREFDWRSQPESDIAPARGRRGALTGGLVGQAVPVVRVGLSDQSPLLAKRKRPMRRASTDTLASRTPIEEDAVSRQHHVLKADRAFIDSRIRQIDGRIASAIEARRVLRTQLTSIAERASLIESEIEELGILVDDRLVPRSRMTSLQRERLEIRQRTEVLKLEETRLDGQIAEARKERVSVQTEDESRLWMQLQADQQELTNIRFSIEAVKAQLGRLSVIAPIDGRIHELAVPNAGTVVQRGEVMLQIVPVEGQSEVSVQIDLASIDDVGIGQSVRLRFDTFKAYAAKELSGTILQISPDRSLDPVTGLPFYAARIGLAEASIADFTTINPTVGAPISVLIETKKRSMADYLLEPVKDAMKKSFTET